MLQFSGPHHHAPQVVLQVDHLPEDLMRQMRPS